MVISRETIILYERRLQMKNIVCKTMIFMGVLLVTYVWISSKWSHKEELHKVVSNIETNKIQVDQSPNLIQAALEDNSLLREEQKQKELEVLRLARINEYIKEGNETLQAACKLIFGEYSTYLTLTHTEDEKNIVEVGAKFQVAYSVDLMMGEIIYNETDRQIELRIPKDSLGVEYCTPTSEVITIGEEQSLLNKLMMPWEVAKREPLKSKAINLLIRDSEDYVKKPFEELEDAATYVIEQLLSSMTLDGEAYEDIEIVWL